jgi:hypothetical protein
MSTFHEEKCTFLIISRPVILSIRTISDKGTLYTIIFFENRTFYEIMWENVVEPGRPHVTIWRTNVACWITRATDTHSEYVILIAFPQQ